MKNYWIIPAITYALSCGGTEVKKDTAIEQKELYYVVQPKVIPAPKCWREGMTGEETLECMMSEESTQDF